MDSATSFGEIGLSDGRPFILEGTDAVRITSVAAPTSSQR
jgi:hypothetical protein